MAKQIPAQPKPVRPPTLWLFEDQLSDRLAMLKAAPPAAPVLLIESDRNFRSVPFHKWRITFLVSAMRHFVDHLRAEGRNVCHYPFSESGYRDSVAALKHHLKSTSVSEIWITEPSEYHTRKWVEKLTSDLGVAVRWWPNDLFLTDRTEFSEWARGLKSPVMEFFYRKMRVKHDVLMDGKKPLGGEWNLDKENRKSAPKKLVVPKPQSFPPDTITHQVMAEVERRFPSHPGHTRGFDLPVTAKQAEQALKDFLDNRLPLFGDLEDAMVTGQPVLFHSVLSPVINAGLLNPMTCIRAAESRLQKKLAPLNAVEGFCRQLLGWREYVYGIYWAFMPEYRERNARKDARPVPSSFWSGQTDMNCLKQSLSGVIERGYSHHIQRLMVICNYATLTGLSPQAVNDWFYAMYIDSHDWVVTPNVIGMGMNADHGTMATKPYVSSGAYINRMSDYCKSCAFDVKQRTGDKACPFNYLFWTFLGEYQQSFSKNPRMTMMLKNYSRLPAEELSAMKTLREKHLDSRKAAQLTAAADAPSAWVAQAAVVPERPPPQPELQRTLSSPHESIGQRAPSNASPANECSLPR